MSRNNAMFEGSPFKLGLFGYNGDGGMCMTKAPERWRATMENTIALAQAADEAGFDYMLPLGRWIGWPGPSNYCHDGLESLTWAAAAGACTKRIVLFATVHLPTIHPVMAARQMVTIDHRLQGRFGLNLVVELGTDDEAALFGTERLEHDERYVRAQEWIDIVRQIWRGADEPRDFDGRHFQVKRIDTVQGPGPYDGDPILFNAGHSTVGRTWAAHNADFCFAQVGLMSGAVAGRAEVEEIKKQALSVGREANVTGTGHIICRPTAKEAQEYYDYVVVEQGDTEAAESQMTVVGLMDLPEKQRLAVRASFVSGGSSYGPVIGSPDDVADQIQVVADAGYAGMAFGFTNYLDELPFFRQEVLPRLEARGLHELVGDLVA